MAWALADARPGRSVALVRRALDDIADVPALTRLTLPGSASRLLSRLDPGRRRGAARAARRAPRGGSFVDLVPLFYGAALLERLGHRADAPALAHRRRAPPAPPASMMDFVDQARRASGCGDAVVAAELEAPCGAGWPSWPAGGAADGPLGPRRAA